MCANVQRGELNDLQRKTPEDLWKEDLAVFIEELDVSFVFNVQNTLPVLHVHNNDLVELL